MENYKCIICNKEIYSYEDQSNSENYNIIYNNDSYPICTKCAKKIENNIKFDAIIKTERGQLIDTIIHTFFEYDYELLYDTEYDYYFQPDVEDVFKYETESGYYNKCDEYIDSINKLGTITDNDIEYIKIIWGIYNENYYQKNKGELASKSIYFKGDDRSGPICDEELDKFIEKIKEYIKGENE